MFRNLKVLLIVLSLGIVSATAFADGPNESVVPTTAHTATVQTSASATRVQSRERVSPKDVAESAMYCEYQYVCNPYGFCVYRWICW